mmetsp:Transcript_33880/g.61174  ORF Transcript_33880/g.61174 Transcript_33880/m.61174 type:complete len:332 (-) Transcript_33880:386-1381(-)|eukprot:CAMPEP_0175055172 /NCGR_PEP_ID=MMETSP0052_2-20121109/9928_1 /TAXON_ID=51329 ORGANISM="Polytomella parva, Strain SAG 63-3" /NCGR_SAMPLE_ID=MMETSP0052_2 /ASSEMBLY_ACC=CAM_ASM_000194 /LENGTH=331 /DNA_ID=CAMNT_0016319979 /DNA_START=79 /DNA_END=1074 /DNA_ORIENTATION=-
MKVGACGLFLALAWMMISLPAIQAINWSICDAGTSLYRPETVTLVPDPPVAGKDATFSIVGTLDGPAITGGRVDYKVLVFGIPIYENTIDLCQTTTCPIEPGQYTIELLQSLPSYAPKGNYHLQVNMYDDDNNEIFCIKVDFHLVHEAVETASGSNKNNAVAALPGGLLPGRTLPVGSTVIRVIRNLLGLSGDSDAAVASQSVGHDSKSNHTHQHWRDSAKQKYHVQSLPNHLNTDSQLSKNEGAASGNKPCRRCLSESRFRKLFFNEDDSKEDAKDNTATDSNSKGSKVTRDRKAHLHYKEMKKKLNKHRNKPKMRVVGEGGKKQVALRR